jgi:hypothetical protein
MSGPRSAADLVEVWLRSLPLHESRALNDLVLAIAFAKQKAESLPPSIDRRCAALINTKLDESEHWVLAAMRAAVDRSDVESLGVVWCPQTVSPCLRECRDNRCALAPR